MTPSEQCKQAGLLSLAELARISGESKENLIGMHKRRPRRFELILKGVIAEQQKASK